MVPVFVDARTKLNQTELQEISSHPSYQRRLPPSASRVSQAPRSGQRQPNIGSSSSSIECVASAERRQQLHPPPPRTITRRSWFPFRHALAGLPLQSRSLLLFRGPPLQWRQETRKKTTTRQAMFRSLCLLLALWVGRADGHAQCYTNERLVHVIRLSFCLICCWCQIVFTAEVGAIRGVWTLYIAFCVNKDSILFVHPC